MSAPAVFPNGDYVASSTRHCHEPLPPMLTLRAARRPSPYRRRKHARQDSARRGRGARMRVRIVPAAVDARADARFPRRIRRACAVLVTVPTFRIANGRPRVAAPHARRSSCRKRIIRALCLRFYFNMHIEIRSDLPPTNRASRSLVKFVFGEEDEHEEALYGTANHRVSEGSRGRYAGQGTVQEAWVQ
ncbi:putative alkyl hydroperoxide reductase, subunit F [Burkholderia mallei]|nr:putative alkyl hydroperoxide reductase, subunit F [Burkholderia mallei]KOT16883.1 putative transposase [Burkholderia mallei]